MVRRFGAIHLLLLSLAVGACGGEGSPEGRAGSAAEMVRAPIMTEMKTILRDIRSAQERAAATSGAYLDWDELREGYMSRPIPEAYTVRVDRVTADGFRARVEHRRSGLACELVVEPGSGSGSPECA